MKIATRFTRVKNGIGYFAIIELESYSADSFKINWQDNNNVNYCKKIFGEIVEKGIIDAFNTHLQSRHQEHYAFTITDFIESTMDTEESAVRCATIKAAWIALGHDEKQVEFEFDVGWNAKINLDL